MANGYRRGDYLTQFLQQLPQIYRAQQSAEIQKAYLAMSQQKYEDAQEQQQLANQMAQQNYKYKVAKQQKDVFDKERDEEQDVIKELESLQKGLGVKWAAKNANYNPALKESGQQYIDTQKDAITMIQNTMMASARTDVSYDDTLYNLKAIKNTPGLSEETIKSVENAEGLINKQYHTESVNAWLQQNPTHPDRNRIALLPTGDAYKEILEKDPSKELSSLLSSVSRSTTILQNEVIMPTLSPTSLKLHQDVVKAGEERVKKIITPKTTPFNANIYEQAVQQVMQRLPNMFTTDADGNPIPKPTFSKMAKAQVDSIYQKLIQQQ